MVADLHLLQNRSSIVCYRDIAVGGDEDLVETTGTQRGLDNICDCSCGKDVGLDSFVAKLASLLPLTASLLVRLRKGLGVNVLSNNNERTTLLILEHGRYSVGQPSHYK